MKILGIFKRKKDHPIETGNIDIKLIENLQKHIELQTEATVIASQQLLAAKEVITRLNEEYSALLAENEQYRKLYLLEDISEGKAKNFIN